MSRYLFPSQVLRKTHLKIKINQDKLDEFKEKLFQFIDLINDVKDEEFNKNFLRDFLNNTFYANNFLNTKEKTDLAIYYDNTQNSDISVLIETKKPNNKSDMISNENLNKKALHQLIFYAFNEKQNANIDIKHLIITDFYRYFVFDANEFDRVFLKNSKLNRLYNSFITQKEQLFKQNKEEIYKNIQRIIEDENLTCNIKYVYFNLLEIQKENSKRKLISLYKFLSPTHLLKEKIQSDNNSLNKPFYDELLYIIGLEEVKDGGKKIIKKKAKSSQASLIENIINQLNTSGRLSNIKLSDYGSSRDEQLFNIALELSITWINRILFLKLLEAKLLNIHNGHFDKFLSSKIIDDYDKLNILFFEVLAKKSNQRDNLEIKEFAKIPYLNSSLFEHTYLEIKTIQMNNLKNHLELKPISNTILKDSNNKKIITPMNSLKYLLDFLDSYNFGFDTNEDTHKKGTLINASVLGLIFEKINGYKDGSFYTPSFITMYISKQSIRQKVLDKFNETFDSSYKDVEELKENITDKLEANKIIDEILICDMSVGSGHFLVSALNELLSIKSDLGILLDNENKRLRDYSLEVENDELYIIDDDNEIFEYKLTEKGNTKKEHQKVQIAIFEAKRKIIENQLFGVDINPNSIKICRLRLWIELLKSTYYNDELELVTLPNIDINIKQGNSLISRYELKDNQSNSKLLKESIDEYKNYVGLYKDTNDKDLKKTIEDKISTIKENYKSKLLNDSSKINQLKTLLNGKSKGKIAIKGYFEEFGFAGIVKDIINNYANEEYFTLYHRFGAKYNPNSSTLFGELELSKKQQKEKADKGAKLLKKIKALYTQIENDKKNQIYKYAFEWRFEFPEVLDDNGDFVGFDIIIGNPPYIKEYTSKKAFDGLRNSNYYQGKMDLWTFFASLGLDILKDNGILSFIAPNNWISNSGASNLREKILYDSKILEFIDFNDYMVFDEASIQTMILALQKSSINDNYQAQYSKLMDKKSNENQIKEFLAQTYKNANYFKSIIDKKSTLHKNITFLEPHIQILLDKIKSKQNFWLDEKEDVAQGIVTPNDNVSKTALKILGEDYKLGEGIFILSDDELESLNLQEKELELIKPLYNSTQIDRYYSNPNNRLWVIYTTSKFKDIDEILPYPNIKRHLDRFEKIITTDNKPYGIHRSRNEKFFKDSKILSLRKCAKKPVFSYVDFDSYVNQAYYVIKPENINLKYLTGLLNSNLIAFWLKHKGKMQGANYQIDKEPILDIPIHIASDSLAKDLDIDNLLNLSPKMRFDRDKRYKILSLDNKEFFMTEFLFAKQRGYIKEYLGHIDLDISFYKLLPYMEKSLYITLENGDDKRVSYGINVDNSRTLLIVTDDDLIISIFIQNNKKLNKQIKNNRLIVKNQFGGTAFPLTLNCPAGSCIKAFWRQTDLIEILYQNLKQKSSTKNNIETIVDKIIEDKKQDKDTTELEKQIDNMVYQLYDLSDDEINIVKNMSNSRKL